MGRWFQYQYTNGDLNLNKNYKAEEEDDQVQAFKPIRAIQSLSKLYIGKPVIRKASFYTLRVRPMNML